MQTGKERGKERGGKERDRQTEQADKTPSNPSQNQKSHQYLVQTKGKDSYWALPTGSHLDVKGTGCQSIEWFDKPTPR